MIPILYDKHETAFVSNGLGRLRDCISCTVTEERNGIYECDFEYPVTGYNYNLIQLGNIIGVTHDDSSDIQPFDIVSFTKPIDGIVTFHCTHISYRLSFIPYSNPINLRINSAAEAFMYFGGGTWQGIEVPFTFTTDITRQAYMTACDGVPRSIRQMLGGIEGSVLDTYGGEYKWDKWDVALYANRGEKVPFAIRYGTNMLTYNDESDASETYSSVIPFWKQEHEKVIGTRVYAGGVTPGNHGECIVLDLTDKFETKPTAAQLATEAQSFINDVQPYLPTRTFNVSFARLQDMSGNENLANLTRCKLCDSIRVIFPDYNTSGYFKIVKVVWNALEDKYEEMELGTLSTSLSQALGISVSPEKSSGGGGSVFYDLDVTNDLNVGNNANIGGNIWADGNIEADGDMNCNGYITTANDFIADGGIYVGGHATPIGTNGTTTNTSATRGNSTSYAGIGLQVSLPKGVWMLTGTITFASNTTGRRAVRLTDAGTAIACSEVVSPPANGAATALHTSAVVENTTSSNRTYAMQCYQNSGATQNVTGELRYVRIA